MKLISCNIRGLNNPSKYRMIKNMIQMERPQIFFMQETKCNSNNLGPILSRAWPGCHSIAVDASGASGGLAIVWDPQVVSISYAHAAHKLIQAVFHILGTNLHGHLTNVYLPVVLYNNPPFFLNFRNKIHLEIGSLFPFQK